MAAPIHGRLGTQTPTNVDAIVYTVPASRKATVTINVVNRGASAASLRLAMIDGAIGTLSNDEYLEYGVSIAPAGVLERTGITLAAGHSIVARESSATGGLSIVIFGIEQDA